MTPGSVVRPDEELLRRAVHHRMPRRQHGQALIYGLFVMVGGLAGLFFLFNTGQLSSEKTRLVNTADAVAYSAGVMHARTLNYFAYTNRAMLANTVAIAQLVSLASWRQYADTTAQQGTDLGNPYKYPAFFPSFMALQGRGTGDDENGGGRNPLQGLAEDADAHIQEVLRNGQQTAHAGLEAVRRQVMEEVAHANYRHGTDGSVIVEPLPGSGDPYHDFVENYSGNERERLGELAQTAAKRDRFQERRSWRLYATMPDCKGALSHGGTDRIERRGGTELLGLDEWKAIDTISEHVWKPKNKYDVACQREAEHVKGYGGHSGSERPSVDFNPLHYDQSALHNRVGTPIAMAQASTNTWDYSGIPSFFDLSVDWLESDDPALLFAIRLRRPIGQTSTSEGRSSIRTTPHLNNYHAQAAGAELVAVSASKVYFRRPAAHCGFSTGESRRNCSAIGSRRSELGSLFNPYWQVSLVQDNHAAQARRLQGVALP